MEEAARLLGVTPAAVPRDIEAGRLLAVLSPDGDVLLPKIQFEDARPLAGLSQVLSAMHITDGWMRTS